MQMVQRIEQVTALFDITRSLIYTCRMYHEYAKDSLPDSMEPILGPLQAQADRAEIALDRAVRAYKGLPVDDRASGPLTEQDGDVLG